MAYHVPGESFQTEHGRSPYQVSLLTKLALQRYNLTSSDGSASFDGSNIENAWGV